MPIIKEVELLKNAKLNNYAVAAFNVENYEMAQAVISKCDELKSPVIIAASKNTLKYIQPRVFVAMVTQISENYSIPVSIHLDHGKSKEDVINAIKAGFDSVMFDGSQLPFFENVAISKECRDICNAFDVCLEGELGAISGKKGENDYILTEPYMALDYIRRTCVDSLAIAIGTCHGVYKAKPSLDYERLRKISSLVDVPLVLHGASGLSNDQIKKCISNGISKINFATDLRMAYTYSIRDFLFTHKEDYDPKLFGAVGMEAVKNIVDTIIKIVGSKGMADEY